MSADDGYVSTYRLPAYYTCNVRRSSPDTERNSRALLPDRSSANGPSYTGQASRRECLTF